MFVTQFEINGARRDSRKLLSSPQSMHASVQQAFPSQDPARSGKGRVLWRLDPSGPRWLLYIVSPTEPDLTHLVEQAGWPERGHGWVTRAYDPFLRTLRVGQHWAFRLAANPTRSGRKNPTSPTQRFGQVTSEQQQEWLLKRATGAGFTFPDSQDPPVIVHNRSVKRFRRGSQQVTLTTAVYDGILRIVDVDEMRTTMIAGLGPAKAYGCGLLTLAPPQTDAR